MTAVTNVNPSFKMLPYFSSEWFCSSFLLFCRLNAPCLHLQLCQNSFFLLCNRSIFFTLTCQRRPSLSNWKQQRQHTKNCLLHAFPLCLVHFGRGASLIQENIQFCCTDLQPPMVRERPRDWRRCLIQAQMSGPEHWLLTKTKINQAHSGSGCSIHLPVAVMWHVT